MAILQTCYCCSSLKQLSLVGGCFTLLLSSLYVIIYYGGNSGAFTMIQTIKTNITRLGDYPDAFSDDRIFWRTSNSHEASGLANNHIPRVVQGSIINPNGFDLSEKSGFYMVKSICDILVILSCGVLFIGLCQEIRGYLVPWIALSTLQASLSLVDTFSKLFLDTTTFEPKTAFIFTLTFLLLFAQIYFILGAISLFQENFQYVNNYHNTNLRTSASHNQMEKKSLVQNKNCQHSSTMYIPMKVLFGGKTILAEDSSQLPTSKVIPTPTLRPPNHESMRKLALDEEAGLRNAKRRLTINRRLTSNTKLEVIQETNMACSSTSVSASGYEANELKPCENAREASGGQNAR